MNAVSSIPLAAIEIDVRNDLLDWLGVLSGLGSIPVALLVVWLGHRFTTEQASRAREAQRAEEADRWRREQRVAHYAALIGALIKFAHSCQIAAAAFRQETGPDLTERGRESAMRWVEDFNDVRRTLSLVVIGGSDTFRIAATDLVDSLSHHLEDPAIKHSVQARAVPISKAGDDAHNGSYQLAAIARGELFPT